KKRKGRVRFRHGNRDRKKKLKREFDKEWAAKLAESDKGSFYQQEKWLEESDIQKSENAAVAESAGRSKIQLEGPDEESQLSSSTPSADGTWKTISGRAIVSSEKLLEKLDESVSCRFCQGRVQVMENVATKHGLEWKFSHGELNCSLEDVEESVVDIGVTIDASWSARGWSASDAVVAAISVDTGK
ncbi:unnamed protein product, partial [Porites evermanni]